MGKVVVVIFLALLTLVGCNSSDYHSVMSKKVVAVWTDMDTFSAQVKTMDYEELRKPALDFQKKMVRYQAEVYKVTVEGQYAKDHEEIKKFIDQMVFFANNMVKYTKDGEGVYISQAKHELDSALTHYHNTVFYEEQ